MKVTYYGHSCFSVALGGKTLLFDPFIKDNDLAEHINIDNIRPDVILISHGHWDHIADAIEIGEKTNALYIANHEISVWLQNKGAKNVHGMNIGGNYRFTWANVKMVNALHSSSLPDSTYGGAPGGFILEAKEGIFYYSGDTAISSDFKLIGDWYDLNFAILPIGDNYTMGSEDAILCADFIQCDRVMGVHYDTFPPIKIDKAEVKQQFKDAGKELFLFEIGEEKEL